MSNIDAVREMAGPAFDDLADADVLDIFAAITRVMGRELKTSEASYFHGALEQRRAKILRDSGKAPAFVPEMYGTHRPDAAERALDSNEQGED